MIFMVVYAPLAIPASYLIDRRGLKVASGSGALLAGVAGVLRGLAGDHFTMVVAATVGAAIAQPLLLAGLVALRLPEPADRPLRQPAVPQRDAV